MDNNEKSRYEELTDEIRHHQLGKYDITENKKAVYIEALYMPYLQSDVKNILLLGYAWRYEDYIYTEYLNLDGYLEKRIYSDYDFPKIYLRFK